MPAAHQTEPCGPLARFLGRAFLWALGWRLEGELPPFPKFVVLGAPHTSNWDLPIVVASCWSYGARMHFLAKSEIFGPATGWFFRAIGGIAVDRTAPHGLVGQMVEAFGSRERLAVMVPPEGTRSREAGWKSGFYHIALAADVPVVASFADYGRKRSGVAGFVRLSGDPRSDMDAIRKLYEGITPRYPELMTPIRLPAESEDPGSSAPR